MVSHARFLRAKRVANIWRRANGKQQRCRMRARRGRDDEGSALPRASQSTRKTPSDKAFQDMPPLRRANGDEARSGFHGRGQQRCSRATEPDTRPPQTRARHCVHTITAETSFATKFKYFSRLTTEGMRAAPKKSLP